jgi:zinc protease
MTDALARVVSFLRRRVIAVAVAALAGAALALSPVVDAAVAPPKLQYQRVTLPNGLTLVLHTDRSTPIVNVQVWYHVGSKNEKPGRTGFAHLFEHMMFKGSKNVEPEQHTSIVSSVGGRANAYTNEDTTVYWETVPSQYLPLVLWMEADRLGSLRIDEQTFVSEREVVKEERRMRVDNLNELLYRHAFTTHPYKNPVIGSMADLDAATITDVREFFNTYYIPANATVIIAGDFDVAETIDLVTRYFGRIPAGAGKVPRDIVQEPAQAKEKRVSLQEAWPLPAVVVAQHITYDGHPDSYPMHVLAKVLSDGNSSRIYRNLVYEKRLAVAAFGSANLIEHPNLFYAVAIVAPGHTPQQVADALIDEMDKLVKEPITTRELERSKNQFARDYVLGRQTVQQKATTLAHAVVLHKGDISTADGEFDIFQNMTAADVQRVARTYFTPQTRVVLTVMPRGARGNGGQQ